MLACGRDVVVPSYCLREVRASRPQLVCEGFSFCSVISPFIVVPQLSYVTGLDFSILLFKLC